MLAALPHALNRQAEDELYRKYVTDTLYYAVRGQLMKHRYADIIESKNVEEDKRTGDEIAADIIREVGLKINGPV